MVSSITPAVRGRKIVIALQEEELPMEPGDRDCTYLKPLLAAVMSGCYHYNASFVSSRHFDQGSRCCVTSIGFIFYRSAIQVAAHA